MTLYFDHGLNGGWGGGYRAAEPVSSVWAKLQSVFLLSVTTEVYKYVYACLHLCSTLFADHFLLLLPILNCISARYISKVF